MPDIYAGLYRREAAVSNPTLIYQLKSLSGIVDLYRQAGRHVWELNEGTLVCIINIHDQQQLDEPNCRSIEIATSTLQHITFVVDNLKEHVEHALMASIPRLSINLFAMLLNHRIKHKATELCYL